MYRLRALPPSPTRPAVSRAPSSLLVALFLGLLGCWGEHAGTDRTTSDLACDPARLRSVFWADAMGTFVDEGTITPNASGTHVLVSGTYGGFTLRLADGSLERGVDMRQLSDALGVRFVVPRLTVDAAGRSDYAGITDVISIGTDTPLAAIPWIVPPDATGTTFVVGHVGQASDRVTLVEYATPFGGGASRSWLRSLRVSAPSDELRVDLTATLPPSPVAFESPFGLVVDEARSIAFVVSQPEERATPSIARVDPALARVSMVQLTVGPPATPINTPQIPPRATQLLATVLSDDGERLYATTYDGALHVLDATTLDEIDAPRRVGVVVANPDTYLPALRSPVAVSPGGALLAVVDEAGRVAIVESSTGLTRATLASAAPTSPAPARPVWLRFVSDTLLVVTDHGVEGYRCAP